MLKILNIAGGVFFGGLLLAVIAWFYLQVSALNSQVQANTQNIQATINYINQQVQAAQNIKK